METESIKASPEEKKYRFGCMQVLGIVAVAMVLTGIATGFWVKHYIYASPFTPTELTAQEQKTLESKLAALEEAGRKNTAIPQKDKSAAPTDMFRPDGSLIPEKYSEDGADRTISLTERELNGLIANNTDVAKRLAVDLSDDLMSIKLVVPMEEDILIFGGKTLRLSMGAILNYENDQPVIALKGVSIGGVPLPNAWLGNLKNKNLVEEFGSDGGFWKLFADGVENISVKDGHIQVSLKE